VDVVMGRARLEEGAPREVGAGHSLRIELGRATIEELRTAAGREAAPARAQEPAAAARALGAASGAEPVAASGAEPSAASGAAPGPDSPTVPAHGTSTVSGEGPAIAGAVPPAAPAGAAVPATPAAEPEVVLQAGEAAVVHDSHGLVVVAIDASRACPGDGRVELEGRAAPSTVLVVARWGAGGHSYRVRCASGTVRRGRVLVQRNAGTVPLPRSAPAITVRTDGRTYTVVYQSALPSIEVAWPSAPAGRWALHAASNGGADHVIDTTDAHHTFESGQLGEGRHHLWFASAGSPRGEAAVAAEAWVDVRFDNQAPTAFIRAPADGALPASGVVHVEGVALPGWSASVGDQALESDASGRFAGDVPVPAGGRPLVIRVGRSGHGVHYFLRRTAPAR